MAPQSLQTPRGCGLIASVIDQVTGLFLPWWVPHRMNQLRSNETMRGNQSRHSGLRQPRRQRGTVPITCSSGQYERLVLCWQGGQNHPLHPRAADSHAKGPVARRGTQNNPSSRLKTLTITGSFSDVCTSVKSILDGIHDGTSRIASRRFIFSLVLSWRVSHFLSPLA